MACADCTPRVANSEVGLKKKDQISTISECLTRLKLLRNQINSADSETRIKIKIESEILAKEISAIRLLQGYDRILNNIAIAVISAIGGGGVLIAFTKFTS